MNIISMGTLSHMPIVVLGGGTNTLNTHTYLTPLKLSKQNPETTVFTITCQETTTTLNLLAHVIIEFLGTKVAHHEVEGW